MKPIFAFCLLLVACASTPSSLVEDKVNINHQATGVVIPKEISGWQLKGDVSENLTPEILAVAEYEYVSEARDFKPKATVYILRNKTSANMQLIENRSLQGIDDPKFIKSENSRLKSKQRVTMKSYNHIADLRSIYSTISMNKEIKVQSLFVQSKSQLQLVFWLRINREIKEDKGIALQFMDDFLLKNKAK